MDLVRRGDNPACWTDTDDRQDAMTQPSDMAAFVRIVDLGGLAPAARDLGLTPSEALALAQQPLWHR